MGKKNVHVVRIGSIPITSSVNPHIARQNMDKCFNLEPPKLRLHQLTKMLADTIAPHISSALRDLGLIFDKSILSRISMLVGEYRAVTADSCYGKKMNRKIHRIILLREISEER